MAATIAVVYDACVLYPAPLRDLLVQLATARMFRAKWTELIHTVDDSFAGIWLLLVLTSDLDHICLCY